VTNSAAITAGAHWFPLAETGGPTARDYEEDFPLENYVLENQSSDEEVDIILDGAPIGSSKRWTIPNGKTRESNPEEQLRFHSIVVVNNDAVTQIEIGELECSFRTY
ncbi:hypothetical protein GOV10_00245, partial [Candidatus Woesearchaeota archaeon]|nr:hypothetical protein [Candidatus Woesearchaeota archaeon]